MQAQLNKDHYDPLFRPTKGDLVYVFTPELKGKLTSRKLLLPYAGPLRLIERCSDVHFKLRRCSDGKALPHKIRINKMVTKNSSYYWNSWARNITRRNRRSVRKWPNTKWITYTVTEHDEEHTLTEIREETHREDKDNDTQEQIKSQPASETESTPSHYHQIKKILYARQGANELQYQVRWLNYKTPSWVYRRDRLSNINKKFFKITSNPFQKALYSTHTFT